MNEIKKNQIHMPKEETRPELDVLTSRLHSAVDRFQILAHEIGIKVQRIKKYPDHEHEPKISDLAVEKTETFVEKMNSFIQNIEENNDKLQFNLIHLNDIV